jgi:DnaJ-domain-containing protein 1
MFTDWLDDALWELADNKEAQEITDKLQKARQILASNPDPQQLKRFLPRVIRQVKFGDNNRRERPVTVTLNYPKSLKLWRARR